MSVYSNRKLFEELQSLFTNIDGFTVSKFCIKYYYDKTGQDVELEFSNGESCRRFDFLGARDISVKHNHGSHFYLLSDIRDFQRESINFLIEDDDGGFNFQCRDVVELDL